MPKVLIQVYKDRQSPEPCESFQTDEDEAIRPSGLLMGASQGRVEVYPDGQEPLRRLTEEEADTLVIGLKALRGDFSEDNVPPYTPGLCPISEADRDNLIIAILRGDF